MEKNTGARRQGSRRLTENMPRVSAADASAGKPRSGKAAGRTSKNGRYRNNSVRADSAKNTAARRKMPSAAPQLLIFAVMLMLSVIILSVLISKPVFVNGDEENTSAMLENPAPGNASDFDISMREGMIREITENISSSNAILIDLRTGRTVCEKKSTEVIYPASLTKIMTAIVAIENMPDPDGTQITVSEATVQRMIRENASVAGFSAGETLTGTDMLYGCLLASGGDASLSLAEYISGSEEAFVELMNKKAVQLGCRDTNFVNATGLHNLKHVTTASDMAKIFAYALGNSVFKNIITSSKYYSSPTEQHPYGITMTSTVFAAFSSAGADMDGVVGGKTGYTPEARQCLATYYEKGDLRYVLVTFGAGDGTNKTYDNAKDAAKIYGSYVKS